MSELSPKCPRTRDKSSFRRDHSCIIVRVSAAPDTALAFPGSRSADFNILSTDSSQRPTRRCVNPSLSRPIERECHRVTNGPGQSLDRELRPVRHKAAHPGTFPDCNRNFLADCVRANRRHMLCVGATANACCSSAVVSSPLMAATM